MQRLPDKALLLTMPALLPVRADTLAVPSPCVGLMEHGAQWLALVLPSVSCMRIAGTCL
jgi:hypothetical protein